MNKKLKITVASGSLILIAWFSNFVNYDPAIFNYSMILATIIAGYEVARKAYYTLKMKVVSINLLVTIAAIGAVIIGEYWEAAAVTFLFTFGDYLQIRTMNKTRNAIKGLMDLAPKTANIIREGKEIEIAAEDVKKGETVVVRPGEKIPVDGKISEGKSEVNQASITGEAIPVSKQKDDEVYSGTINETGYLEIEAEKVGEDTTFAKIIELVEEAQEKKAPTQALLERFSKYYTPGIILLAVITYLITRDTRLALTLLVIGCPGALVISTPVSVVAGIGNAAKNGVLIKGGEHLEKAGKIDLVAFDKTGTLTEGKPVVTDLIAWEVKEAELLKLAASVEKSSEHHLANAIIDKADDDYYEIENFNSVTGAGVIATLNEEQILVGNDKLMRDYNINISEKMRSEKTKFEQKGKTVVYLVQGEKVLGLIAISDKAREDAREVVNNLKNIGVKKVVMLTGDNSEIAKSIADDLNIDEFQAELLPAEKVKVIEQYQKQGYTVAMVGDGINDSPSLATADIGIAMGAAGTDVAIDTADITLMADKISKIPFAIGLSMATTNNIKQNIVFAVTVVFALLAGVLGKFVFLASGMLVHEVSVLLVIFNAMRLLRYKQKSGGKNYA